MGDDVEVGGVWRWSAFVGVGGGARMALVR